jgi:hypothetical protein
MVSKASVVQWLGFHLPKVEVRVRFTAVANLFFRVYFIFFIFAFIFYIFKDPLRSCNTFLTIFYTIS